MGFADSITNDAAAMNKLEDKFRNCYKKIPDAVLKASEKVEPPKSVASVDVSEFEARLKTIVLITPRQT